jgi:transcription elongation factor Elf1
MVRPTRVEFFRCPKCEALYQLVRAKAVPETTNEGEIPCLVCGAPLSAREGELVLKYFLLRQAVRRKAWQKRRPASQ